MSLTPVTEGQSVTLTCRSSCPVDTNPTYIWYHTRQPVTNQHTISGNTLTLSSVSKRDAGRYSCALRGHEDHPSPSVCVLNCWSVVYTHQSICAVKGSSVDLGCSYSYPSNVIVTETFWHKPEMMEDLSKKGEYANRVTYLGNNDSDSAMRIEDLRESDSGEYRFRFLTNDTAGRFSGSPGISLSVLTLQVEMSPTTVTEGQSVTLTCRPTCDTGVEPTFVWYKNGLPVANQRRTTYRTMTINSVSKTHSGRYSCAVQGHENHPSPAVALNVQYSPKNTSASISPSSNIVEGNSVTLTCSSDANPPVHNYTWYKINRGETTVGSGQNYNIFNINSEDTGQYYCRATNVVGFSNSTFLSIDVFYSPKNTSASISPSSNIVEGNSVTLTCSSDANPPVHNYTWYKINRGVTTVGSGQNHSINIIKSEDTGQYYCRMENSVGSTNSTVLYVNVSYSPKNTSTSISPPGDIVEGNSVTLTCSSDANPPVYNYTWYKINRGETTLESGQNHSINNIKSEDTGQYYCRVGNSVGSINSTVLRRQTSTKGRDRIADDRQGDSGPVCDDIAAVPMTSDPKQRVDSGDEDDVQYASVQFKARNKDKAPDCTATQPHVQERKENVTYASVNICRPSSGGNQRGETSTKGTNRSVDNRQQKDSEPMYDDIAAMPMTSDSKKMADSGEDVDVQYASVQFKARNKDKAPDSTAPQPHIQEKKEDVTYASMNITSASAAVNA
ncbi:hypothetical protein ACEWY4_017779 [Coilia grayii]|uniref:Ig-like domain-containing protein n=1 Tax=Coilia grayii TaxID=363190 RepID=A0ABD1JHS1_9TELE